MAAKKAAKIALTYMLVLVSILIVSAAMFGLDTVSPYSICIGLSYALVIGACYYSGYKQALCDSNKK